MIYQEERAAKIYNFFELERRFKIIQNREEKKSRSKSKCKHELHQSHRSRRLSSLDLLLEQDNTTEAGIGGEDLVRSLGRAVCVGDPLIGVLLLFFI